ncbi:amino acid ABC transporter substrate-binding protein [Pseudomonas aeruginosa]|uniref:amino acid ABC transporter substrate-binding protein n=1 Tax=Pseudomonas aeruginosa TaxID=287 RepID=UPI001F4B0392|nr:amino acid ABC transporter substrate-binding protein [Pseudomonas aeruginosa]
MTIMKGTWLLLAAVCLGASATAEAGATLDAVKRKGYVQCGVSDGLPGFSYADAKGRFKGLDVDICRALAAALFGDAEKVRFTPLSATERFSALQSGTVDLLSRNTSWTSSRDTALSIHFTGVTYFDGQGFLVNRKLGVSSARELKDATVCIQSGTTNELNVADYFRAHGIRYKAVLDDSYEKSARALEAGQCDVLSSDQSQLYAQRLKLAKPEQYVVLPEVISKEPLGPAVRQGDEAWFNIVRWTLYGLLNAEELGVTSSNVERQARDSRNPDVARLLGSEGDAGKDLQLPRDWVVQMVRQVGNYGEIFARNVGDGSPLKMPRGLNAQWNLGGLHYAPPIR